MSKKCVKCGKSDDSIINYYYARTFGEFKDVETKVGNYVPVCKDCAKKFDKYRKQKDYKTNAISVLSCLFVLTIFWVISWANLFSHVVFIPIIVSSICALVIILLSISIIRSPDRISRYFEIQKSGKIIFKDGEYDEHLKSEMVNDIKEDFRLRSQETSYIECPKCGTKQFMKQDFCETCGKDLRLLKK